MLTKKDIISAPSSSFSRRFHLPETRDVQFNFSFSEILDLPLTSIMPFRSCFVHALDDGRLPGYRVTSVRN